MNAFMIKTSGGRFYVKAWSADRFLVDVNGEEVILEKDEDGYVRAPGATLAGHRLNMQLLNHIAAQITAHTI
ncbi:hypothetical protein [Chitinophaga nivalis]|uniref:Uncharacterized protein n=1 Tax=Chitinophaga nivalis TaxID=2991709 RepID=A0ABT3IID2_9BACT|nr:hypothetical protein [Chitinophaga nivalis]MCW3466581.1 hypothetical protein [Chitinophaga nivalis]MCW3483728.1 hypothetical protein [Chitinophaga nivalis]